MGHPCKLENFILVSELWKWYLLGCCFFLLSSLNGKWFKLDYKLQDYILITKKIIWFVNFVLILCLFSFQPSSWAAPSPTRFSLSSTFGWTQASTPSAFTCCPRSSTRKSLPAISRPSASSFQSCPTTKPNILAFPRPAPSSPITTATKSHLLNARQTRRNCFVWGTHAFSFFYDFKICFLFNNSSRTEVFLWICFVLIVVE